MRRRNIVVLGLALVLHMGLGYAAQGEYPWPEEDWTFSVAEEQSMDSSRLAEIGDFIRQTRPGCKSLLVARHGVLVYEEYFRGERKDNTSNVYSVTKSITSAMMGIAVDDAQIEGLDLPVVHFFPEYFTPFIRPLKREITIRHCLTMSTGWSDRGTDRERDWRRSVVWSDLESHPGEKWVYRNGPVHLMAGIIEKLLRGSLADLTRQRLFDPMKIRNWSWNTDAQGHPFGSHGLFLRPQDMAKFGYLYLRGGRWKDLQLVPAGWVAESTGFQIGRTEPGTGYGYLWWLSSAGGYPMYSAEGAGGQSIVVIPGLDLVVVTTADHTITQPGVGEVIRRFVLPAVLDQPDIDPPDLTDEEGELP